MKCFAWLLALSVFGATQLVRADSLTDLFARGNRALARGEYEAAIEEYETLLDARIEDPAVTYNLALAYARHGKLGQAIRYFERTLRIAPGDADAKRALKQVRDALGEQQVRKYGEAIVPERPPLASALFADFHADTLAWFLLGSCVGLSAALLALFFVRTETLRLTCGVTASLWFVCSALGAFGLWAKTDFGAAGRPAIIVSARATLREGPDEAARVAGELSEGEIVRVLAQDGRFAHVKASRGVEGFVPKSAVGEI